MPLSRKEQLRCLTITGVELGKPLWARNNGLPLTPLRFAPRAAEPGRWAASSINRSFSINKETIR